MHRMSHEGETAQKLLSEKNLITIGWSVLDKYEDEVINKARSLAKKDFAEYFVDLGKSISNEYMSATKSYFLYNFLRLKKGDKVIIPFPKSIKIVEVVDPATVYKSDGPDIGFTAKVDIIVDQASRYDYICSSLSSKLKYRGTNLVISKENKCNLVDDLINNIKKGKTTYNFGETKSKMVDLVFEYLKNDITETHFEVLIRSYLDNLGADYSEISSKKRKHSKNDSSADVDVKAVFIDLNICVYVQAKHHNHYTGRKGIDQLIEYKHEVDDTYESLQPIKWLITTAKLSEDDEEYARINGVRVIDDCGFAECLIDSGVRLSDDIFKK